MAQEFHEAPKAWAQIKHQVLSQYLNLFLGKLGKSQPKVFYIDGFAGPGRLKDGSEGSSLKIARIAANPIQPSRQGVLHCINVELDPETFADLKASTKPYAHCVTNLQSSFADALPSILEMIGDSPAIFFIDPFGTQGIEIPTLQTIAKRKGVSEVLVRFDDTRVKRLIRWATNNREHFDSRNRSIAEGLWERIEKLSHEEDTGKILELLDREEKVESKQILISGYKSKVTRDTNFRYGLSFPIQNPRTGGHRYFLVHFCSHPDGYIHMANFMARADRAYQKMAFEAQNDIFASGCDQLEFPTILQEADKSVNESKTTKVREALPGISQMKGWHKKRVQNRDVFAAIVEAFDWTILRSEYLKAFRDLKKQGLLDFTSADDNEYTTFH